MRRGHFSQGPHSLFHGGTARGPLLITSYTNYDAPTMEQKYQCRIRPINEMAQAVAFQCPIWSDQLYIWLSFILHLIFVHSGRWQPH